LGNRDFADKNIKFGTQLEDALRIFFWL